LRLGTKLALSLLVIIILVLSGHGYFQILSRRDILVRMMKVEVEAIGKTLRVSLEEHTPLGEKEFVKAIIDAVDEYEKTLGVVVFLEGEGLLFRSRSLNEGIDSYVELIKRSIHEDRTLEGFGVYKKDPVFSYTLPFKDNTGRILGGISILQHTSFVEDDIRKAEWNIFITIFILTAATVGMILLVTRRWITSPISQLMDGIRKLSSGNLNTHIVLKRRDEFSALARTFNQLAVNLKTAQEKIIQEAESRLQLERDLRQSEKLATVGQLASGLAHDIGTPLNIISGRAELVKRRLDENEENQKDLNVIVQQTEKITKIIQQLLGFVRKKKPEQKPLNVGLVLETTLEFFDYLIQKQGIKVVKEVVTPLPPVTGDLDQLNQVFSNLFLNAMQAMPEGGMLRLSVSKKWISKAGLSKSECPYIEVSIEDTGVGMEKDVLMKIFDPFFTTKEEDKGTGLGLTVSQGIVEDHEGWIEVESEIGKGSVFRVYLPSFEEVQSEGERS
jgi:two-component system, NtrC family, sensor kinase